MALHAGEGRQPGPFQARFHHGAANLLVREGVHASEDGFARRNRRVEVGEEAGLFGRVDGGGGKVFFGRLEVRDLRGLLVLFGVAEPGEGFPGHRFEAGPFGHTGECGFRFDLRHRGRTRVFELRVKSDVHEDRLVGAVHPGEGRDSDVVRPRRLREVGQGLWSLDEAHRPGTCLTVHFLGDPNQFFIGEVARGIAKEGRGFRFAGEQGLE